MKVLLKKEWKYTFYMNDIGVHVLTVICGMIGIYEVEHILTNEELAKFKKQGEQFIDDLANDISYYPDKYMKK